MHDLDLTALNITICIHNILIGLWFSWQRKRAWTTEQASFPDETPLEFRKASVRTKVATSSISSAWLRCGDGFQSTSVLQVRSWSAYGASQRCKLMVMGLSIQFSFYGQSKNNKTSVYNKPVTDHWAFKSFVTPLSKCLSDGMFKPLSGHIFLYSQK